MRDLKRYYDNMPEWSKWLLGVLIAVVGYKWLTAKVSELKVKQEIKDELKKYDTGSITSGVSYNIHSNIMDVWHIFYDGVFLKVFSSDQDKIVSIINGVPYALRTTFNKAYAEALIANKGEQFVPSWVPGSHYGKTLQEDCKYFLDGEHYEMLRPWFNQL